MNGMNRVVTSVLAAVMTFGLTATALADVPAAVAPSQIPAATKADREARQALRNSLAAERDQLKEQQGILKTLHDDLKAKLEQVKALVAQARQSGDKQALLKARADRNAVQAHLQVVREKTQANKSLWQDLKAAVQARDAKEAARIASQLIANRQVKIEALGDVSRELDRLIQDLKTAIGATPSPTSVPPQTPVLN